MQSFIGAVRSARTRCSDFSSVRAGLGFGGSGNGGFPAPVCIKNGSGCSLFRVLASSLYSVAAEGSSLSHSPQACGTQLPLLSQLNKNVGANLPQSASSLATFSQRSMSTVSEDASDPALPIAPRIKFKRLDKTARNIMQILDREAVEEVKAQREVPDIKPGYIIQMKVVSPENKRRVTTIKGIVIARRNADKMNGFVN
ncbi:hypothetical protein V2J09_006827 [Rumex salicifolius]